MATNNMERKNAAMPVKRRLIAAVCLLLLSTLMLVSASYAWLTLSVKPEAKGMDSLIAGNGSLEIALVTTNVDAIGTGRGASASATGNTAVTANGNWGNIIDLTDASYGMDRIALAPAKLNMNNSGVVDANPFSIPVYGYDGRVKDLPNASLNSFDNTQNTFTVTDKYGLRAITNADGTDTYGYVMDLAFRINTAKDDGTAAKLKIQPSAVARVAGATQEGLQGHGSAITFQKEGETDDVAYTEADVQAYLGSIKLAFIQNFGTTDEAQVLAYAKAGSDGTLQVCDQAGTVITGENENVILPEMISGQIYQISVVVWMDGSTLTNANVAVNNNVVDHSTVLLQFTTDAVLQVNDIVNTIS